METRTMNPLGMQDGNGVQHSSSAVHMLKLGGWTFRLKTGITSSTQ